MPLEAEAEENDTTLRKHECLDGEDGPQQPQLCRTRASDCREHELEIEGARHPYAERKRRSVADGNRPARTVS